MIWPVFAALLFSLLMTLPARRAPRPRRSLVPQPLLTAAERVAYQRLRQSFPDRIILAQVRAIDFSVDAKTSSVRPDATFVVCAPEPAVLPD